MMTLFLFLRLYHLLHRHQLFLSPAYKVKVKVALFPVSVESGRPKYFLKINALNHSNFIK